MRRPVEPVRGLDGAAPWGTVGPAGGALAPMAESSGCIDAASSSAAADETSTLL